MDEDIRKVLDENGNLAVDVDTLKDEDNLYQAGLTSHASVNVMLALEEEFEIEFPESMLRRSTFESVAAIRNAIGSLKGSVSSESNT